MKIRLAGEITTDSVVDGEGIRSVVWCQGCIHNCPGCHNPETHSFDTGILRDVEDVCEDDEIEKIYRYKDKKGDWVTVYKLKSTRGE